MNPEEKTVMLYNEYAEQAVLGSILTEPELIKECPLTPEHFSPGKHFNIYFTMQDLDRKGQSVDFTSIAARVGEKLPQLGGFGYLTELAASVASTTTFKQHCQTVSEYFQKRKAISIAQQIIENVNESEDGPVKPIQEAVSELMEIEASGTDDDDGSIDEALVTVYEEIESADGSITGVPSGFTELDRMTYGYKPGNFVLIAARPSMGKTAFALKQAKNMSDNDDVVNLHSLEMGKKENIKRLIVTAGSINAQKIKAARRDFASEDWGKLSMAIGEISNSNINIFDKAGQSVNYIWSKTRQTKRKNPGKRVIVMIDYLQLLEPAKANDSRTNQISQISRDLKKMARELDVVVIALSQLSRQVEQRQDKRPMLSDLRESGQLEQDADIIEFLYRDDYYDKESESKNIVEVIIAKHRDGPVGTVSLAFIKEYGNFVNLERRFDDR